MEKDEELLKRIKAHVDRIWSDCFDAPPEFTAEQLSTISAAITAAKLAIEREFE